MLKVVVDVVLTKCMARQEVAEAVVQRWPTWFRLLICSWDDSGVAGMTTTWGV